MIAQNLKMTSTQDSNPLDKLSEGEKAIFSPSSYEVKDVNNEELWKKIFNSLCLVLSSEFSSEIKRTPVSHKDRISFSCVYCGDSLKDPRKKRGNIFSATMQYHCFNGDCNAHLSIYDFLKDKGHLNSFTVEEQFFMKETNDKRSLDLKKLKASLGLETFFSDEIDDLSVDREFFIKKLGLQEIRGSRIEKYLLGRMQRDFHKFGWDPKNNLLYVFNLNSSLDRIIGCQLKTFKKKNPYLTWKLSKIHQELGIYKEENREILEKMDFLSNIFGILQIDLNKPITIFEGPLDSFLFPNAVGICSAKNSLPFEVEGSRYFYDNDHTGREWSLRRIQEGKSVFLWRKFLKENELTVTESIIKDLNDLLIYLRKHKKQCKRFIDYFSSDKYDAIWI
jgi:hypothetical protein